MPGDDDFELWLGRIGAKDRSVGHTLARARRAGGVASARGRRFTGAAIGRGAGVGRDLGASQRMSGMRVRRVVVKARIVKLGGKGMAAAAHLRYLQRDGTTREGARGALYGPDENHADGKQFLERGQGDRHQFRFVVAPEDGAEYEDLKPLVRRLMSQAEKDLGTRLDWVAVDHFNTGHPHSHVMLRGVDERGNDLVIARDYLTQGLRARAEELVSLDLGPRTTQEIMAAQDREIGQERFTGIDRRLLREANGDRQLMITTSDPRDHALRIGRLRTLAQLGLASEGTASQWTLDPDLEPTLRRMGERGDIIRTLNRELREAGIARPPQDHALFNTHDPAATPIIGRLVATGLSDEHRDRRYMIIDGIDGRSHYADIGEDQAAYGRGAIMRLSPRPAEIRAVDRTVAAIASQHEGKYSVDIHLRHDPAMSESGAQAHVRRLEAMRRSIGRPERLADGTWQVGPDHLADALAHEQRQGLKTPVIIETLSHRPLEQLPGHNGETWLDRQLTDATPEPLQRGFGAEVRAAMQQRQQWLVEQQLADGEGGVTRYRRNMLHLLQRRELDRVIAGVEQDTGLAHRPPHGDAPIEGVYRRAVQVGDRRYALIEKSREFSLVPWRPVLERAVGKSVSGVMRGEGISWTIGGRARGLGIG
ncbi:MAG: relaxase/mobilization nuclease RlxS [Sphingobium sp.]